MTRPLKYFVNRQIRFDQGTCDGIDEYIRYVKVQAGVKITDSDAIRTLVREALIARKIIENDNL